MPSLKYQDLQKRKNQLIRKALQGSLFGGRYGTVAALSSLTGTDSSLNQLPTGYSDFGWMTTDGLQFSRDVSSSDISSFGSVEPTRSDITSDIESLEVSLQETNIHTISLISGISEDQLVPDAASGELKVAKPATPSADYWRLLAFGCDIVNGQELYVGRHLPRAKVTAYADSAIANGDDPLLWGATFQGMKDDALATPTAKIDFFGGPGWKALLVDMGFASEDVTAWVAATAYAVDDEVTISDGSVLKCTVAGTSGSTAPTAPGVGSTVVDNTVTWEQIA